MKTDASHSVTGLAAAHHMAKLVTRCPMCERDEYVALIENGSLGFRLLALNCEYCKADIVSAYHRIAQPAQPRGGITSPSSLLSLVLMAACVALVGVAGAWFVSM